MRNLLWVTLLVLMLLPRGASAQPQGTCTTGTCTPIAKMDCGASGVNFPQCDADVLGGLDHLDISWSRSLQSGVGPNGEDAYRISHIGTTDTAHEYYHMGLGWTVPAVTQGHCRYHREIIRFLTPIDWYDDAEGRFGFKHIVQGADGTPDVNRFFVNFRSDDDTPPFGEHVLMRAEKNIDGGVTRADIHDLVDTSEVAGGWHFFQWEVCSSSTAVATDATLKVWRNNNTYASPTVSATGGFAWPTDDWTRLAIGFYGESLGVGHNAVYEIAAYENDDQFDTNWYHTGGGGSPPASATRARPRLRR